MSALTTAPSLLPEKLLMSVSDGMTADDLYFKWDHKGDPDNLKSAVAIGDELIMSQFAVDDFTVDEITASYVTGI